MFEQKEGDCLLQYLHIIPILPNLPNIRCFCSVPQITEPERLLNRAKFLKRKIENWPNSTPIYSASLSFPFKLIHHVIQISMIFLIFLGFPQLPLL